MPQAPDYTIHNIDVVPSPALVVYKQQVLHNIKTIGKLLGGYDRLTPHIKTHKMSRIARLEMEAGIKAFKCATLKEAEMLADVGARDITISCQLVGPLVRRVAEFRLDHPRVNLSVIGDDFDALDRLGKMCCKLDVTIGVLVDIDTGMGRTGAPPGDPSVRLARQVAELPGLQFEGLHVYDGHVGRATDDARKEAAKWSIQLAVETRRQVESRGLECLRLVASGSKGFDVTAGTEGVDEVSPGSWIFWDVGCSESLPFPFNWAALVVSRVISTPGPDLITLDAGNKSISPDRQAPHFKIWNLDAEPEFLIRNEEHQTLRIPEGTARPNVGDVFYLVPSHVCTTVNLWDEALLIDELGYFVETWAVDARGH